VRKVLQIIERMIEQIGELGLLISGVLILVMAFLSTYGVGRRYFLHHPEPYSYELSTMLLVACVVFAVAGLQRHMRHLRVDFISNYFSANVKSILLNIVTPVFALFYVLIITWKSWENALYSMRIDEMSQSSWQEPLFPIKLFVPIGMALLCLVLVAQLSHGIVSLIGMIKRKQS
jgi:TRAP-type mannitol/chloroaromatic compound transport system permease small subunit